MSAVPGLGERAPCWAVMVLPGVQDKGLVAHTAAVGTLDLPGTLHWVGSELSLGQVLTGGETPTKQGENEGCAEPASLLPGVHWLSAPAAMSQDPALLGRMCP